MKTVVNIEHGKPLHVERYEGKLKVGERTVTFNDFIKGLLSEVEIDFIFDHLINDRNSEFVSVAENIYDATANARTVMSTLIATLSKNELPKKELDEMTTAIFHHVVPTVENAEQFAELMHIYLDKVRILKGPRYEELVEKLFETVVNNSQDSKLAKSLIQQLITTLKYKYPSKRNLEPVQEWVKLFLPLLDKSWLKAEYERVMDTKRNGPIKMQYGFTTLPKGCVGVSMNSTGKVYVLEVPKSQFRTKLFDLVYENVGHPRLLFLVHTDDEKVIKVQCVAIKDQEEIHEDMVLYHYPYSNVFQDGRICWGGCPTELSMIGNIPMLFLSTMNNKHLCPNITELYEEYQNKSFDDKKLVPFNSGLILKDLYE